MMKWPQETKRCVTTGAVLLCLSSLCNPTACFMVPNNRCGKSKFLDASPSIRNEIIERRQGRWWWSSSSSSWCLLAISNSSQSEAATSTETEKSISRHKSNDDHRKDDDDDDGKHAASAKKATATAFRSPPRSRRSRIKYLNLKLDAIASQCSQAGNPVVQYASQVEELYRNADDKDTITLNILLKAWNRATAVLASNQHILDDSMKAPIIEVYTGRDAAEHCTKILMEAERSHAECRLQEKKLNAAAAEASKSATSNEDHGVAGETDFDLPSSCMIAPDTHSYNVVIDAWAKCASPDGPQTAERVLKKLIDHESLQADSASYNGILDAWAHSKDPNAHVRLNQVFKRMQDLATEENSAVRPTKKTLNYLLLSIVKRVSQAENRESAMGLATECRELMNSLRSQIQNSKDDEEGAPDIATFTLLMDGFARVGTVEAAEEAEAIFREAKALSKERPGDVHYQPNVRTYTTLIHAWSRTRSDHAVVRALELLDEMRVVYEDRLKNDPSVHAASPQDTTKPNARAYTAVIQTLSRSRNLDKAQMALRLLKEMREKAKEPGNSDVAPYIITYNSVIDVCARCGTSEYDTRRQTDALKIAVAVLKTIKTDPNVRINCGTFSILLQATAYLLPAGPERNQVASAVFTQAKDAGLVNFDCIKNFRKSVDTRATYEMLGCMQDSSGRIDYDLIPRAWSKNVRRPANRN